MRHLRDRSRRPHPRPPEDKQVNPAPGEAPGGSGVSSRPPEGALGADGGTGIPAGALGRRGPRSKRVVRGPLRPAGSRRTRDLPRPLTHTELHHVGVVGPGHDQGDEGHGHPGQHLLATLEDVGRRHLPCRAAAGGIGAGAATGGGCSYGRRCEAGPGRAGGQALGGPQWAGEGRLRRPPPPPSRGRRSASASCRPHLRCPPREGSEHVPLSRAGSVAEVSFCTGGAVSGRDPPQP